MTVLRGFIAKSNEQYRKAGLEEFQMRVERDGSVTIPTRAARSQAVRARANAAAAQATAGAAQATTGSAQASSGAVPSAPTQASTTSGVSDVPRTGAAPQITAMKPTKAGFNMSWKPVTGAVKYGIWVGGSLIGEVPKATFIGTIEPGSGGIIQVDSVAKDGTRSELSRALVVARTSSGELQVQDAATVAAQVASEQAQQ